MDEKILIPIIIIPIVLVLFLNIFSGVDDSSSGSESETLTVNLYGSGLGLIEDHVEEGSESVTNVTGNTLVRGTDYSMDYTNGRITFLG